MLGCASAAAPDQNLLSAGASGSPLISARRHVHQFVAVEHALRLGAVEIALPTRSDDGSHAVADQIAERAGHADEPVHRKHQHETNRRNTRNGIQRGGQDNNRRTGNTMRTLGRDQRYAQHQHQIPEGKRRVGGLGDENDRKRQVDRERVEIERIAGRDNQPDDRILHAEPLKFAHDLRKHRVRRRGRENNRQFLAQIAQELEDVQSDERHDAAEDAEDEDRQRHIKQGNQRDQLLERADPVFADRIANRSQHAQRGQTYDQPHRPEQNGRYRIDERADALALFSSDQREADAENDREKQHLEHVVARQRVERSGRNDIHEEAADAAALQIVRVVGKGTERLGVQRRGIDVHAVARPEQVGEQQTDDQRDRGHDLEIDQRLDADPADFLEVAGARDAVHHDAEHDRSDDHRNQLQKGVAQDLELDGKIRHRHAECYSQQQSRQDLNEK